MSGTFSIGGLITGLDSQTLISQLIQLERPPITRMQQRVTALQGQRTALQQLRTQLQTLRSTAQDFRFDNPFNKFTAESMDDTVVTATASGQNSVAGTYTVNVTRLASATTLAGSGRLGATMATGTPLASSGIGTAVTAGTFSINGVSFTVDPATQSLDDILAAINSSAAGVTATHDAATDTITLTNATGGDASLINLGATADTSNFLAAVNLRGATQRTNADGSTEVTSTRNLGSVNPGRELVDTSFASGAMTSGAFSINGISFTVDTAADSLSDVLSRINSSDAQVYASYDSATDTVRLVSRALGSRTISLAAGTSNFLSVTNLAGATQTAGNDAEFSINGGPAIVRNSNEVSDAIGGVTLNLRSQGTTSVTVATDDAAAVDGVNAFLKDLNDSLTSLQSLTASGGALYGDSSLRTVADYLKATIFSTVTGTGGTFSSLVDIGVNTGDTFDSKATTQYQLDKDAFLKALQTDRAGVVALFTNDGLSGIADQLRTYLDGVTGSGGFLYERVRANGSIDRSIEDLNDRISRMEDRLSQHETRLRKQFARLEQLSATYQSQNSALSSLGSGLATL